MVISVHDEVASDKLEQKSMDESKSEPIENTTNVSELPQQEIVEFQNSEKVSDEEQQSQNSNFDNGLTIVVSSTPEIVQDRYIGQDLNSGNYFIQCGKQQIRTPSRCVDKGLEDGYNWRKYGQKLVRGNEFVRSYYRCTHPSCRAKRQVERSQDGRITDTVYIGNHEHDRPQPGSQQSVFSVTPIKSVEPKVGPLTTEEDKSFNTHGPAPTVHEKTESMGIPPVPSTPVKNVLDGSVLHPVTPNSMKDEINHDDDSPSKRQKRDLSDIDESSMEKPYGEPRFVGDPRVVQTMSEVDVLQDGYRWRKYGQKLVKGNPNPRSYYRCSSSGCPVKKHVERASYDAKLVITTYEGKHDHDIPPARTVTPNRGGAMANTTALDNETRPAPEEKIPAIGLDMVVQ